MTRQKQITAATLLRAKQHNEKTVWLTAYDAVSAQIAETAGCDVLLVGDSLGMVCLGYDSTIPVTLDQMIHHTAAVVRGRSHAWVVCDLPFGTYQQSKEQAFASSVRVLQETGCDAVKIEGGEHMAETIRFLSDRGIAVVAHIGLTPQSVKKFGSYGKRGKSEGERLQLLKDAESVCNAGAVSLVLENIPTDLAGEITGTLPVPTVGIGAGSDCNAQVLVWNDLLGISASNPPFAPAYANLRQIMSDAVSRWADDVKSGRFPE
ncbi:3-methyl-2-oxobutanoate hydroxymethyltransferase [Mariprofundus ferrooxydans]|uniref:3-methyl-2-oxobutanoate hydroxymethyltransferase n=1 Tax=Mariprofundus ferrooxydans PV-1 TaxID=314345 RepID=Q0F247_9PROT|nr:3-methyl-2-oxobutanoate hydroxymethyltransferase [Mariprofundus ferrooxydans]EAU55703.1 3-methyl-2-oxobutanoate hydroxymethyltransferase [Mariprofundus ferrooxydans PV-1]KON47867.1 3-methyl-2-oxobutanoate hydroxymethyltransferase [Mariprofundus ferrooxydans]